MTFVPRAQEIYRHFKGKLYQIVTVAEHTETGEALVVYQAMYGDFRVYARPLSMFCSKVDREKYPDVEQEYRFQLLQTGSVALECEKLQTGSAGLECEKLQTGSAALECEKPQAGSIASEWVNTLAGGMDSECEKALAPNVGEVAVKEKNEVWVAEPVKAAEPNRIPSAEGGDSEEPNLDPMLLAFLDAETYAEKLNILAGLHHKITDDMITTMAVASDVEIEEGDLESRYNQLKNCLLTLDRYEITRLR